ncbi:MAG: DUF4875 domain-containing protein [Rhodobacteraceae bacterium]|nr:DUF4875 domain-containing protein [Paracoccaceae bacterium]
MLPLNFLAWLSAAYIVFIGLGFFTQNWIFIGAISLVLGIVITPPVFKFVERPLKRKMASAGMDGRFSQLMRHFLAIVIAGAVILLCIQTFIVPKLNHVDLSEAKLYTVVSEEVSDKTDRRWGTYFITLAEPASTFDDFAQTAIRAARDKQAETNADVVTVFLEPSIGMAETAQSLAIVIYTPDGKGFSGHDVNNFWHVTAVRAMPSQEEMDFWVGWKQLYGKSTSDIASVVDMDDPGEVFRALDLPEDYVVWTPELEPYRYGAN